MYTFHLTCQCGHTKMHYNMSCAITGYKSMYVLASREVNVDMMLNNHKTSNYKRFFYIFYVFYWMLSTWIGR